MIEYIGPFLVGIGKTRPRLVKPSSKGWMVKGEEPARGTNDCKPMAAWALLFSAASIVNSLWESEVVLSGCALEIEAASSLGRTGVNFSGEDGA